MMISMANPRRLVEDLTLFLLKNHRARRAFRPGDGWGGACPRLVSRPGREVTEAQLRNLFGEGWHPLADWIEADRLPAGEAPAAVRRARALGRRMKATWADLVFHPQPTLTLLWVL
jgi:hypothetical protein